MYFIYVSDAPVRCVHKHEHAHEYSRLMVKQSTQTCRERSHFGFTDVCVDWTLKSITSMATLSNLPPLIFRQVCSQVFNSQNSFLGDEHCCMQLYIMGELVTRFCQMQQGSSKQQLICH
jgi:hypothetical protein